MHLSHLQKLAKHHHRTGSRDFGTGGSRLQWLLAYSTRPRDCKVDNIHYRLRKVDHQSAFRSQLSTRDFLENDVRSCQTSNVLSAILTTFSASLPTQISTLSSSATWLQVLQEVRLQLNNEKYECHKLQILGAPISKDGVKPNISEVDVIVNKPLPTDVSEL